MSSRILIRSLPALGLANLRRQLFMLASNSDQMASGSEIDALRSSLAIPNGA